MSRVTSFCAVVGALCLVFTSCKSADGCSSDQECKGDRICESGKCVSPPAASTGSPATGTDRTEAIPGTGEVAGTAPTDGAQGTAAKPDSDTKPAGTGGAPTATPATPPRPAVATRAVRLAGAPRLGAAMPMVVITEFGDFKCPYCARSTGVIRKLLEKYGKTDGDITFEWRHNPLESHPGADVYAAAAVAAQLQGRFWQLHDQLFSRAETPEAALPDLARRAGLDLATWQTDRASAEVIERVAADRAIALALGATGTPTFFVNGRLLAGARTFEQFDKVVAEEIARAKAKVAGGAKRHTVVAQLTRANNKDFARYTIDGKTPPETKRTPPPIADTVWQVLVRGDDPALGPADALVTVVEFGDFQCPFCARYSPVLRELQAAWPKDVRLVWKHNPLAFHADAALAAEAAVEAQRQGRFWPFHDRLMQHQAALKKADLLAHAKAIGMKVDALESALTARKHRARVESDLALAAAVQAVGTPIVFINGRKVVGARSLAELKALVETERDKASKHAAAGTPRSALYQSLVAKGERKAPLAGQKTRFSREHAPATGPVDAPIDLVVFADFQCPFSSRLVPILDRVTQTYQGKVRLTFKHFPQDFHPRAQASAEVAACAHEQRKFWALHAQLFDLKQQKKQSDADVRGYAKKAGLDLAKLDACVTSGLGKRRVAADLTEAKAAGVKGTPTVFLNGQQFRSPTGYNDRSFMRIFNELLAEPAGQPPK